MYKLCAAWRLPSFAAKTMVLLLSGCLYSFSGMGITSDSIRTDSSRTRWILSLDARSTIIDRRHLNVNGIKTGIGFGNKGHKVTVGYYWLNYGSKQRLINWRKRLAESINLSYYTKTDVRFVSFAYWYPLYNKKKWVVSFPAEVGLGQETAAYRQISGNEYLGTIDSFFYPYQIGVYAEYRATPWVGLAVQTGYRDALYHGPLRRHFKGMYYSYGLTFYPGKIYRDAKSYLKRKSQ